MVAINRLQTLHDIANVKLIVYFVVWYAQSMRLLDIDYAYNAHLIHFFELYIDYILSVATRTMIYCIPYSSWLGA